MLIKFGALKTRKKIVPRLQRGIFINAHPDVSRPAIISLRLQRKRTFDKLGKLGKLGKTDRHLRLKNVKSNLMSHGKITKITPRAAIAGGEVIIECEDLPMKSGSATRCYFNNIRARETGFSSRRVIALVPDLPVYSFARGAGKAEVKLFCDNDYSFPFDITVGLKLADELHIVANPAVDPDDDHVIATRSGSRGQQLPVTLFRIHDADDISEITGDLMNPTGIAFNRAGEMFVTSRAEGTVYRVNRADEIVPFASNLGIATGIAFDRNGDMFVGDRSGTIYKINAVGDSEVFATLEQSIAAYHLAFGPDNALYVTRPNVASFDSVMRIDQDGEVSTFFRGLGRPQGLAFDRDGNLYVAACLKHQRGIVRINREGSQAEMFVAGMNVVGLCFGRKGEMYVATNDAVFSLNLGIYGTLLN